MERGYYRRQKQHAGGMRDGGRVATDGVGEGAARLVCDTDGGKTCRKAGWQREDTLYFLIMGQNLSMFVKSESVYVPTNSLHVNTV